MRITMLRGGIAAAAVTLLMAGCASATPTETTPEAPDSLTLLTHDSFYLSEGVLEQFTAETGIEVQVQAVGDAGAMVNQLVLTQGSPLGDVVFGIDNTFASRAVAGDVLSDYVSPAAVEGSPELLLPAGQGGEQLTPIDFGDVCVNADLEWFAEAGLAVPTSLDDLIDPAYAGLFVTPAASTSSPGLAFLLTTVAAYGEDGWEDYWRALVANDVKITAGWSDAYYVDFSGPSSEGSRPLVLSYASSPSAEVGEGATEAPTAALLDTCFRQVEYAGVVNGTAHPEAAAQLVDFLYSVPVQEDVPGSMYVYPANPEADLPAVWAQFAAVAEQPYSLDAEAIEAGREGWITAWSEIATP